MTYMSPDHFPRPALAAEFANEMLGRVPLSDAPNGLFISGPRRTGKTAFLRFDLKPELEKCGVLVIYADLWADEPKTLLDRLIHPIRDAVQANLGAISKMVKSAGLDKLSIPGVAQIDLSKIGKTDGLSLYATLKMLHDATAKPIALIVDEAQEGLTSEEGQSAMRALKSARDQMKTPQGSSLMLVMAGSHRDKLMRLLNTSAAPFWGSEVRALQPLGDDFVQHLLSKVKAGRPEWAAVSRLRMQEAFAHFGHRPQFFRNALMQHAKDAPDAKSFEDALLKAAKSQQRAQREEHTENYKALEPLQQAIVARMLDLGAAFAPYDESAKKFYAHHTGGPVSTAQVQSALDALRNDERRLIWKSLRGEYSIYDQSMVEWHSVLVAEGNWPPRGSG